ncbi:MAG: cytochrome-c oxidase, cbb3-type subunit III [Burkholderiaceae bacterium]
MSSFWSWWVIALIVFNLGVSFFLFLWGPHAKIPVLSDGTTGHVWAHGTIREGMHRLPRWWLIVSALMFAGAFGYLALYPGFGNFPGHLGWTSHGELAQDTASNQKLQDVVMQRIARLPVEQVAKDPEALAIGKVLFADNCAACHGSAGRGNQLLGAPDLTDDDWLYGGDGQTILTTILDGRNGVMPPWGAALGAQAVDNLAHYVLSLSRGAPHDAVRVLKVGAGKSQFSACAACHGINGKGNPTLGAPNLTDNIWLYGGTLEDVQETIRNGRNGNMPAWRNRLGENDSRVLAAYVYSLSPNHPAPAH